MIYYSNELMMMASKALRDRGGIQLTKGRLNKGTLL